MAKTFKQLEASPEAVRYVLINDGRAIAGEDGAVLVFSSIADAAAKQDELDMPNMVIGGLGDEKWKELQATVSYVEL